MAAIDFYSEDILFKPSKPRKTKQWIQEVISREGKTLEHLNYIFCSDAYLLSINEKYLRHKTLTDIITFDSSEKKGIIEGEIFISVERVRSNATDLKVTFDDEIHRVIIHGVLHLIGYSDKSASEKVLMRKKEDAYLSLRTQ